MRKVMSRNVFIVWPFLLFILTCRAQSHEDLCLFNKDSRLYPFYFLGVLLIANLLILVFGVLILLNLSTVKRLEVESRLMEVLDGSLQRTLPILLCEEMQFRSQIIQLQQNAKHSALKQ